MSFKVHKNTLISWRIKNRDAQLIRNTIQQFLDQDFETNIVLLQIRVYPNIKFNNGYTTEAMNLFRVNLEPKTREICRYCDMKLDAQCHEGRFCNLGCEIGSAQDGC